MPEPPSLIEIVCRPLEEVDVDDRYLAWFRDPDVVRFLESRDLERAEVIAFLNAGRGKQRFIDAICMSPSGLHIGNVKIDVNWKHSTADLSILIGDKAHWGKGIASMAVRLMTEKAFLRLGIRKLTAGIYAVNLGSLRCFERAGWRLDSIQRDHLLFEGRA
ncbi:MAG: acetyltransferase, partial [Planctomycetota bacterium]